MHRSNFAASRFSAMWHWHCVVDASYPWLSDWTRLQWAFCIVAHETVESILWVRVAIGNTSQITCVTGAIGRTAWFFLLYMPAKIKFCVFLSYDVMLYSTVQSSCVRLCDVDVAYRQLSAQLAHAVGESIFCREGWQRGWSQMTLGRTCYTEQSFRETCANLNLSIYWAAKFNCDHRVYE